MRSQDGGTDKCAHCGRRDALPYHRGEKCRRCSDCCQCELRRRMDLRGCLAASSFTCALQDREVVIVAQPEPGLSKIVQLRSHSRNETLPLREAVHTRSPNDIQPQRCGTPNAVVIVQEQTFGGAFDGQCNGLALSAIQSCSPKLLRSGDISQVENVNP